MEEGASRHVCSIRENVMSHGNEADRISVHTLAYNASRYSIDNHPFVSCFHVPSEIKLGGCWELLGTVAHYEMNCLMDDFGLHAVFPLTIRPTAFIDKVISLSDLDTSTLPFVTATGHAERPQQRKTGRRVVL